MNNKKILFADARQKLHKGTQILNDVVTTTLGPMGQNVAIDLGFETQVIHDGVNVARQVQLKDKTENLGVRILREAAIKTVDTVGDGTTATILLGHAIFTEELKMISAGINPMSLRRDIEEAKDLVIEELNGLKIPVKTFEQIVQVATVSAEDPELGEMIAKTLHKLGEDGLITVEPSHSSHTEIDHREGLEFNNGWMLPQFVTDPNRMESTVENAFILVTDLEITDSNHLVPLFEQLGKAGIKDLVFIAGDCQSTALQSMVINKLQGTANINVIKNPSFGPSDKLFLEDIAVLTGGRFISREIHNDITNVTIEDLGRADRVTSTRSATQIVGGRGDKKVIKTRVESLKAQLENHEGTEMEKEKLQERISKLSKGISVLKVGGYTEIEMKERRERALDAVSATKAAMREGIVPGGEVAYLVARRALSDNLDNFAYKLLYDALEKPFKKLMENAGIDAGKALAQLEIRNDPYYGYDVQSGKIKDMVKSGIIDPVSVPKTALQNAISVAVQLASTGASIVPIEEVSKK